MKRTVFIIFGMLLALVVGVSIGRYLLPYTETGLRSPFVFQETEKEFPLKQYEFAALRERTFKPSTIYIEEELAKQELFTSYIFSYTPLGKKMTGQLNIPKIVTSNTPVIVMLRGYAPLSIYTTGLGTRNAAAKLAEAGFITIAPDFFGYGESEPEPNDSWQARFEKPVIVIELIKTIQQSGIPVPTSNSHKTNSIGIWAHSNGGQIAISVLEITKEAIPTTLWAPVTAPFPYSVLFFSDEDDDEGKGMRLWVNQLERDYELKNFSITQYLDGLSGPLQLHHGAADEAALKVWSDEFMAKIERENDRRAFLLKQYEESATESAKAADPMLQPIDVSYFEYPGADHNLVPSWNTVVERDIKFYTKHLVLSDTNNTP